MKNRTRMGKVLAYLGIFLFVTGIGFNQSIGYIDKSEPYTSFSIPLIIIGMVLTISSNFFKKKPNK